MKNINFWLISAVLFGIFIFTPLSVKACEIQPYAESYINEINDILGGSKPKLRIDEKKIVGTMGFYKNGVIHIYKNDYKGECDDITPYLKSIIAHEYAHHIQIRFEKITKLRGEDLALIAEHSIGDGILKNVEYDNQNQKKYIEEYEKMLKLVSLNNK